MGSSNHHRNSLGESLSLADQQRIRQRFKTVQLNDIMKFFNAEICFLWLK